MLTMKINDKESTDKRWGCRVGSGLDMWHLRHLRRILRRSRYVDL